MKPGCPECGEGDTIRKNRPGEYGLCGGCNRYRVLAFIAACGCEDSDTRICAACARDVRQLATTRQQEG